MMSLARLVVLVLALAGAVALAWSNPTMDDYVRFVESELHRALDRMDDRTPSLDQRLIRDVVRAQSKHLMDDIVRPSTLRTNWGLLSRYETRVADIQVVVLGIGGKFIPLSGVEEATVKIGRMAF